jgi:cyclohexanecarboxylate-CoA ligase
MLTLMWFAAVLAAGHGWDRIAVRDGCQLLWPAMTAQQPDPAINPVRQSRATSGRVRMGNTEPWVDVRPSASLARRYRDLGLWRDATPAADLRSWARETPDAVAITAHVAGAGIVQMTYRDYADQVERVAAVLAGLGVGPGDVVALQLPNWWQVNAVVLACARLGAVVAPVVMAVRARELELMLSRLQPVACVTTDVWDGYKHSAALATIAARVPSLRHRLIVGGRTEPGEIDFTRGTELVTPGEFIAGDAAEDADRVSMVLFTSGTTGTPRAVLHSFNTFHAGCKSLAVRRGLTSNHVEFAPHALAHALGQLLGNMLPLYLGAGALVADTWNPDRGLDMLANHGVTAMSGAPVFLEATAEAARTRNIKPSRLRELIAGATSVPASLVETARANLGITVQTAWGMTEVTGPTLTSALEDPLDWAVHSIGRAHMALEMDLRSDGPVSAENPARMFVRGACVCLATMGRDGGEVDVVASQDDGWYDTGDLAVPDGRGGVRMIGRAADRIGGVLMIPAADVEDALCAHPDILDAALVGYGPGSQLACAVVVSRKPLTLEEVRAYLDSIKMTDWYQPSRLEFLERLPRNATGEVDKHRLRAWLSTFDEA